MWVAVGATERSTAARPYLVFSVSWAGRDGDGKPSGRVNTSSTFL